MKSLAKSILTEMALDLGDNPDFIDPQKKQKISGGTHPYANNPAFPQQKPARRQGAPFKDDVARRDTTNSYSELVGSHAYNGIVDKVRQYTGQDPRRMNPHQLTMTLMQAMHAACNAEAAHRPELERAAIEVVLSLPEFRDAREAYEANDLKIEAHLLDPNAMMQKMQQRIQGAEPDADEAEEQEAPERPERPERKAPEKMQVEPGEETDDERAEMGLDVPEIRGEYDAEAAKRKMINLLIQGCLPDTAYVLTKNGYMQLKDFSAGTVWTGNEWAPGTKVAMGDDAVVRVTLSNGYIFTCDTRHKFLGSVGAWPEWVPVLNSVGIALSTSTYPDTEGATPEDAEFWYWIGRYYGDGHITYYRKRGGNHRKTSDPLCPDGDSGRAHIHWCFGHDEKVDVDRCVAYWKSRGVKTSTRLQLRNGKPKNYDVLLHSSKLIRTWRGYGVSPNKKSFEKRLTPLAYTLDKARRVALYRGYYDADGNCPNAAQRQITSVSRGLLQDYQLLCRTIGIVTEIKGPYGNTGNRNFYRLVDGEKFSSRKIIVENVEVTTEKSAMYTLSVDNDRHSFDAEGVVSKNSAINKNYAYHQIADRLRQIDPSILTNYGKAMSIGELMYWMMPEDMLNQMMSTGQGGGGMEEVTFEPTEFEAPAAYDPEAEKGGGGGGEDMPQPEQPTEQPSGVWTIKASAMIFPVLIQELTKGLYEFLSHNEDDPSDTRKYAYNKGDTLANEQWDIAIGPGVWRHLNHLVNLANGTELMSRVYRHLVTLPTGEFNQKMRDILSETPAGRQYIQQLVAEIRGAADGRREESAAYRVIRGLQG